MPPFVLIVPALILDSRIAGAQFQARARPATIAEVAMGNVLLGGLTAATRAILSRKDPIRAFGFGAFGGAIHVTGKHIAVQRGTANVWLGNAVAGTGTSVVTNAGRGAGVFEEVTIPVAVARVRWTPRQRSARLTINAFETAWLVGAFMTPNIDLDWKRSISTGTTVFVTRNRRLEFEDEQVFGVAASSVILVDTVAWNLPSTLRHELTHIHQHWFVQDAWGKPADDFIRRRIPAGRLIPSWLDLGIAAPAMLWLEGHLPGRSGVRAIAEAEAERLAIR